MRSGRSRPSPRSQSHGAQPAILGGFAVLVAALVFFALHSFNVRVSDDLRGLRELPSQTISPGEADTGTVALWIGDSYTLGAGADNQQTGNYVALSCQRLAWTCIADARGGSGYGNTDANSPAERIDEDRAKVDPDIIVVDLGRNDHTRSMVAIRAVVPPALRRLSDAFPDAKIVLVAPFYVTQSTDPMPEGFSAFYRKQARRFEAAYVDPTADGWASLPASDQYRDHIHPNAAGYVIYGARFASDIAALKLPGADAGT